MYIKDLNNHTVCLIDKSTGEVSTKYKGFSSKFILPIGGTYNIIRNKTETIINRKSYNDYEIKSCNI